MAGLDALIRDHAATGRPPMRLVGQMGWVFSSPPGIEQLVAYEASVNEVLNRGKTPTVCVYDVRRLSGSMMMDLLRAHPLTVMNGVLHENPFYTPAEEMLRDIQRARARELSGMSEPPPSGPGDGAGRLQRCIRDLAALNALPSMCVGRSPDETLDIVLDALPTALGCDLVYLTLPGSPPRERAALRGAPVPDAQLAELRAVTAADGDGADALVVLGGQRLWCLEAEVPIGAERGRLLAGRRAPLDPRRTASSSAAPPTSSAPRSRPRTCSRPRGARTTSWRCWGTSCATRSRRS